ncbi:MAG: hypothetical protein HC875_40985 [Anaerolineales bacterium]|nr:hypothetical protein [Anaerolineales bacterium]
MQLAQEQRIAAERWAVLGKAAGSLAHRINNTTNPGANCGAAFARTAPAGQAGAGPEAGN